MLEPHLERLLHRDEAGEARPVVVMTCGVSGAGKSTLAKHITATYPRFTRLSIDTIIFEAHGLYNIDYPASRYAALQAEAQKAVKLELCRLLDAGERNVVLDMAFWNKAYRQEYKDLIEEHGGRWVLVFLDADRDTLWKRIARRKEERDGLGAADVRRNGDSAFDVDEETFDAYFHGFERPEGEEEMRIHVD